MADLSLVSNLIVLICHKLISFHKRFLTPLLGTCLASAYAQLAGRLAFVYFRTYLNRA